MTNISNAPLLKQQQSVPNTVTPSIPDITPEGQTALNQIKPAPRPEPVPQTQAEAMPQTRAEPKIDELQFLAHSGENNTLADIEAESSRIINIGTKILAIGLTLQGLYHLYQSIYFVFVKVPLLEKSLAAGLLERDQVIVLAVKGIIEITTAILSMFFALRLNIVSEKAAERIDTAISVGIFLTNAMIIDFFRGLDVDLVLTDISRVLLEYITDLPLRLLSLIPFL
jgi:hypothetical protein